MPKTANKSARPTMLVTPSVSRGCNPQIAAKARPGAGIAENQYAQGVYE